MWLNSTAQPPMFVYEAWGEQAKDDERYTTGIFICGHRLLVHKEQLQGFLQSQGLDLVVEVEVTRLERETRRYTGEEEKKTREGRYDRLYRLQSGGALEVAEGCIGDWTSYSPRA